MQVVTIKYGTPAVPFDIMLKRVQKCFVNVTLIVYLSPDNSTNETSRRLAAQAKQLIIIEIQTCGKMCNQI